MSPPRLQMIVALAVGLGLVAVPLYMWRRPSAGVAADAVDAAGALAVVDAGPALGVAAVGAAGPPPPLVTVSEARVLSCQDPGSRRAAPDPCDHVVAIEQSFAKAIHEAACPGVAPSGGSIQFVADVSFFRKRMPLIVTAPRDARSVKSTRALATCIAAVRKGFAAAAPKDLATVPHQHGRYKVAITASYPAPSGAALPSVPPLR